MIHPVGGTVPRLLRRPGEAAAAAQGRHPFRTSLPRLASRLPNLVGRCSATRTRRVIAPSSNSAQRGSISTAMRLASSRTTRLSRAKLGSQSGRRARRRNARPRKASRLRCRLIRRMFACRSISSAKPGARFKMLKPARPGKVGGGVMLRIAVDPEIGSPSPELRNYVVEWVIDAKKRGCRNLSQHAHFHFPPLHAANPAAAHKHQECRRCARKIIEKFNPLVLGEVRTAGNSTSPCPCVRPCSRRARRRGDHLLSCAWSVLRGEHDREKCASFSAGRPGLRSRIHRARRSRSYEADGPRIVAC